MISAHNEIELDNVTQRSIYDMIVDTNTTSCVDTEAGLMETGYYLVNLIIIQKHNNRLISLFQPDCELHHETSIWIFCCCSIFPIVEIPYVHCLSEIQL